MRTLTLTAAGLAASALLAFSAQAATLSISADKSTYNTGETITLTITGDSQFGSALAINGSVLYDTFLTTVTSQMQTPHTSFMAVPWLTGVLFLDNPNIGFADAFNQLAGGLTAFTVDQLQIATITLTADAVGVADFNWHSQLSNALSLNFFGLTSASGISVTIVPEPTTAALLGIGLLGLAVAGRRR